MILQEIIRSYWLNYAKINEFYYKSLFPLKTFFIILKLNMK